MGYRELHRMEIEEVVRRWQVQESQRAIARATGLARETVKKYLAAAISLGLSATGPPPTEAQLLELRRLGVVVAQPVKRVAPQLAMLELYRDQIATWLDQDHLLLTRIQELLEAQRVPVKYTSLRRFVRQAGLWKQPRSTVRMAPTAPGEVAEMDFEKLGTLINPITGKRQVVYGLLVVLVYSRYAFLWPLLQQTVEATIEGLEQAWRFFGGLPVRLILDNFPAAVAGPDPLNPRPTRAFVEYSQARGLLLDPARIRAPRDKPHVEAGVKYARERWWKGGHFIDLGDSRQQAEHWCRDVAGVRVHGTTRRLPRVVFEDEERMHLRPYDGIPYDVPLWREVTVHPDHHVSVQYALYSAPSTTCPPGTKLEARCDRALVKLYRAGELVKVHPRKPKGGRSTDYDDYPPERTAYAMRSPDRVIRQAMKLGPNVGHFAERLLEGPFPWSKLRQGQKLLRLADRYTPERLDAACARALGFDLLEVRRVERILVLALEHERSASATTRATRPTTAGRTVHSTGYGLRSSLSAGGCQRHTCWGGALVSLDADLVRLLKRLKLGQLVPTLPERLALARAQQLDYAAFLTLLLADEVQRREQQALERHLDQAGFEERVTLDAFDWSSPVHVDRHQLQHVFTLQFLQRKEHVILVGPVGVGKTFLVQALGAAAVRAGHSAVFTRADGLLKDLGQARADHTYERVFRRYLAPDLLILDDFALHRLSAQQSEDLYDLIIERHRHASFALTSNRGVDEWLGLFDNPILGNSALDRLANAAHQLVLEGPSYRAKLAPKHRGVDDQP